MARAAQDLVEYVLGVILPLALGGRSIRARLSDGSSLSWGLVLGLWVVCIGAKYVPLAMHAFDLSRRDRVEIALAIEQRIRPQRT